MKNLASIVFAACIVVGTTVATDADDRLVLVGASYGKNVLAICESDGKVLWKHDTAGPQKRHAGHHDVHLLPNGNILFHDSWTKTQEITLGKEVVWEYDSATMNGNESRKVDVHAGTASELKAAMSRYLQSIEAENIQEVYQARFADLDRFETMARSVHAKAIEQAKGDQGAISSANEKLKNDLARFEKNRNECRAKMKETEF